MSFIGPVAELYLMTAEIRWKMRDSD